MLRKNNSLIEILGEVISHLEKRTGVLGKSSLRLLAGLLAGLGSLVLFAKLSEDLMYDELLTFDRVGTQIVRSISSSQMTYIMKLISWLGSPVFITIVGLGVMAYFGLVRRHFWDTVLVPVALLGGIILNEALKDLFRRQRPSLPHLVKVSGFSFPSGHSMMSFIFYSMIAYLLYLNFSGKREKTARVAAIAGAAVVTVAVGISRIYLGVHYPSDVVAGFAAGSFWLVACVYTLKGIRHYKAEHK